MSASRVQISPHLNCLMSTSNIKSPISVRQGFIQEWITSPRVLDSKGENILEISKIVSCELNKVNVTVLQLLKNETTLEIVFFRWLQKPFISRSKKRLVRRHKSILNFTKKVKGIKPKRSKKGRKKNTRLTFKEKRLRRLLIKKIKTSKWKRFKKRGLNLDVRLQKAMTYEIPFIVKWRISKAFLPSVSMPSSFVFNNVYKSNLWNKLNIKVTDTSKLIKQPLIRSLTNLKFVLDAVRLYDLVSLKLANTAPLGLCIGAALARNTSKQSQRKFLRFLKQIPTLIQTFEGVNNRKRTWSWVLKVTGKLGGASRTQAFYIRPKQLPLHSLGLPFEYTETTAATKYGIFSIKIWRIL